MRRPIPCSDLSVDRPTEAAWEGPGGLSCIEYDRSSRRYGICPFIVDSCANLLTDEYFTDHRFPGTDSYVERLCRQECAEWTLVTERVFRRVEAE